MYNLTARAAIYTFRTGEVTQYATEPGESVATMLRAFHLFWWSFSRGEVVASTTDLRPKRSFPPQTIQVSCREPSNETISPEQLARATN